MVSDFILPSKTWDCKWPAYPDISHLLDQPFSEIINHLFSSLPSDDFNLLAIGWWFVWFFRNQVVFREVASSTLSAVAAISKFAQNWLKVNSSLPHFLTILSGSPPPV